MEKGGSTGDSLYWTNIAEYIKDINQSFCPSAAGVLRIYTNSYTVNVIGSNPTCNIQGSGGVGSNHFLGYK